MHTYTYTQDLNMSLCLQTAHKYAHAYMHINTYMQDLHMSLCLQTSHKCAHAYKHINTYMQVLDMSLCLQTSHAPKTPRQGEVCMSLYGFERLLYSHIYTYIHTYIHTYTHAPKTQSQGNASLYEICLCGYTDSIGRWSM
jgi:hypothetical protein